MARFSADLLTAFEPEEVPPRSAPRYLRLLGEELNFVLGEHGVRTLEAIRDFYLTSSGDFGQLIRELLSEAVGERLRRANKCAAEDEARAGGFVWDQHTQTFVKHGPAD
jgi:hypothetical protein